MIHLMNTHVKCTAKHILVFKKYELRVLGLKIIALVKEINKK